MSTPKTFYMRFGKRLFDLAVALPALVLLAPLLVVLAFLVRLNLGAPVLFRQPRPGVGGRTFTLVKFRSMTNACDSDGNLLPDEQRLTRFGRFLRSTSLDELPELLNVLCGEMSLIGPRPLLVRYLPYYSERERTRQDVRPGLTGWAQVNGRANLPWDERLEMDAWYVENCTLLLDLKILARTVGKVLRREDINADPALNIRYFDEERKQQAAGAVGPGTLG